EDRDRVERAARAAFDDGTPYDQEFRILRADTGEERWIRARGRWSSEGEGRGGGRFVGIDMDITEAKSAQAALAASEAEYRAIFENSVVGKAQADPATLRFVRANRHLCDILGYGEAELLGGMSIIQIIHPDDRAEVEAGLRAALAAERSYALEARLLRKDGGERWVTGSVLVLPRAPGRTAAIVATVQDVTERRRAEERQALLSREVDHRAKNVLAVVQAALRLTPRTDADAFARAVEGRVGALARTQTLLAEGRWTGAPLRTLIEGELAAFVSPGEDESQPRARLAGPPMLVTIEAAQPLVMALHELATNATKYGALSVAGGILTVTWRADPTEQTLRLDWVETGGPAVSGPPDRRGFGSRVLESMLNQLGGKATLEWRTEGLACSFTAPLKAVLGPVAARAAAASN
ncbi:MAG: PAS domain S-box protein, partial [Pseudomonadota bacterium]